MKKYILSVLILSAISIVLILLLILNPRMKMSTLSDGSTEKTLIFNNHYKVVYLNISKTSRVLNATLTFEASSTKINLFDDPSFEETVNFSLPPHYSGNCQKSNISAHSGNYSGRCISGDYSMPFQHPILPNMTYTFEFWHKGDSCYYLGFLISGSGLEGTGKGLYGTSTGNLKFYGEWQKGGFVFKTQPEAYIEPHLSLTIGHFYGCNGNIDGGWIDDIGIYPHLSVVASPLLDVGNDRDYEWSYAGEFTSVEKTGDFSNEINQFLDSCMQDSNNYCLVPLVFYSNSTSAIKISNIHAEYISTKYSWLYIIIIFLLAITEIYCSPKNAIKTKIL